MKTIIANWKQQIINEAKQIGLNITGSQHGEGDMPYSLIELTGHFELDDEHLHQIKDKVKEHFPFNESLNHMADKFYQSLQDLLPQTNEAALLWLKEHDGEHDWERNRLVCDYMKAVKNNAEDFGYDISFNEKQFQANKTYFLSQLLYYFAQRAKTVYALLNH